MGSFLRGNLVWILLSLFLSTALWVVVTFQQNPDVTNTLTGVPVEVTGAPATVVVQAETQTVQLAVSAPRDVWPQLTKDKFHVIVDASKVQAGVQSVTPKVVTLDPRARVDDVSPPQVTLRVEPFDSKQVQVQVIPQGSPPFGYTAGAPKTTPSQVTVSGPQTSVEQVQNVVVNVSLNGITQTIDETAKPTPETAAGGTVDRITVSPEVLVEIPIEKQLTYKVVPIAPNIQGQVAPGYQLASFAPDPTTVRLVGDPKVLDQLQVIPTQPVNVDGLTADRDVATSLALPSTVAVVSPQSIVVHLHVQELNGSITILVSPRAANENPNYTYQLTPSGVNVTISGPTTALSRLQPEDVQVIVDVKDMQPGTSQSIAPLIGVPPPLKLVNAQPPTVTVAVR